MTKQGNTADMEQFAISLADKCEDHEAWLAIVRFGLGAFMENQALMYEYARKAREVPAKSNVSTNASTNDLATQA